MSRNNYGPTRMSGLPEGEQNMSSSSPGSDNVVVALTDHELDKYALLEKTLQAAGFFELLQDHWEKSGKAKSEFRIVLKPNLTMLLRRADVATYTDPFLVIHLLRLLLQKGYPNLTVVETQNLYGNWFQNRGVLMIAARAGYLEETKFEEFRDQKSAEILVKGGGVNARVPLIDMTLDQTPHDLGPPIGTVPLGRPWLEADFRINFPKLKTHFYAYYTLAIKNIYGCLPAQDKVTEYHCRKAVGKWTAEMIREFPVHFTIVDGFSAADGWMGVKMKAVARKPHTMIAGTDVLAIDHFGASLMGLRPEQSVLYRHLAKLIPPQPYRVVGNYEKLKPWRNPPGLIVAGSVALEANAAIMISFGYLATGGSDRHFPSKPLTRGAMKILLYLLSTPVAFFSDIGLFRLSLRKRKFYQALREMREQFPLLSSSSRLRSLAAFLSPADLAALADILRLAPREAVTFSGHYLFVDGREVPFPSRLSTAALAATALVNYAVKNPDRREPLVRELTALREWHEENLGPDQKYSFCYR